MSIEVVTRSFVLSLTNPDNQVLLIKCNDKAMAEMKKFIRLDSLHWKSCGDLNNTIKQPHTVATANGPLECPRGLIAWSLVENNIEFRPLGGFGDLTFSVPLTKLAEVLCHETNEGRWDDHCVGQMGYEGKTFYLYTHMLFKDWVTVTDREGFYITMKYNGAPGINAWIPGDYYQTDVWRDTMSTQTGDDRQPWQALNRTIEKFMSQWSTIHVFREYFGIMVANDYFGSK